MCCVAEIGMFVWGIILLVTGRFKVTGDRVVTGAMARVIGVILVLPLPLGIGLGLVIGGVRVAKGQPVDAASLQFLTPIEAALVGLCLAIALILGFVCGESLESSRRRTRRRRVDDEDEYEDRRPRNSRYNDEEDEFDEDEPPRRRRRTEEAYEDEEGPNEGIREKPR